MADTLTPKQLQADLKQALDERNTAAKKLRINTQNIDEGIEQKARKGVVQTFSQELDENDSLKEVQLRRIFQRRTTQLDGDARIYATAVEIILGSNQTAKLQQALNRDDATEAAKILHTSAKKFTEASNRERRNSSSGFIYENQSRGQQRAIIKAADRIQDRFDPLITLIEAQEEVEVLEGKLQRTEHKATASEVEEMVDGARGRAEKETDALQYVAAQGTPKQKEQLTKILDQTQDALERFETALENIGEGLEDASTTYEDVKGKTGNKDTREGVGSLRNTQKNLGTLLEHEETLLANLDKLDVELSDTAGKTLGAMIKSTREAAHELAEITKDGQVNRKELSKGERKKEGVSDKIEAAKKAATSLKKGLQDEIEEIAEGLDLVEKGETDPDSITKIGQSAVYIATDKDSPGDKER